MKSLLTQSVDRTNQKKRHTLKVLSVATASSLFATHAAHALLSETSSSSQHNSLAAGVLDCTLITQPDSQISHLLLSNPTDSAVVIERFNSALIRFDNGLMSRTNQPYATPIVVPSFDDLMVEFNLKPGFVTAVAPGKVVNLESATRYLPERTRVSTFSATVTNGVAEIRSFNRLASQQPTLA